MKNQYGSELITDVEKAVDTLKKNVSFRHVRMRRALIELVREGMLNVFEDGSVSLTEKARPVAEDLEWEDIQRGTVPRICHACGEGPCLSDSPSCNDAALQSWEEIPAGNKRTGR